MSHKKGVDKKCIAYYFYAWGDIFYNCHHPYWGTSVLKKLAVLSFITFLLLFFSNLAKADVEGAWTMNITEKIKTKTRSTYHPKLTTNSFINNFSEIWVFANDGRLIINGEEFGYWYQKKTKIIITLKQTKMSERFIAFLDGDTVGYDSAQIYNVKKLTISAKEKKGWLQGKYTFN
jgi:hypothetical protein